MKKEKLKKLSSVLLVSAIIVAAGFMLAVMIKQGGKETPVVTPAEEGKATPSVAETENEVADYDDPYDTRVEAGLTVSDLMQEEENVLAGEMIPDEYGYYRLDAVAYSLLLCNLESYLSCYGENEGTLAYVQGSFYDNQNYPGFKVEYESNSGERATIDCVYSVGARCYHFESALENKAA